MEISFLFYIKQMLESPMLFVSVVLTLMVIFVNGWTDAPNAIATCVTTRCMEVRAAILMAAVFNFLGVVIMTVFNAKVAMTIKNMVNFNGEHRSALVALCAALVAIVVWAVAAWYFGIPTSESHALIAGLSGAAIALQGGIKGINLSEWIKVFYGLLLSTVLGFLMGYIICKGIVILFSNKNRQKANQIFCIGQIVGSAATSFMHGAQDGQKFMGVLLLSLFLINGEDTTTAAVLPIWMMLLCSVVMGVGTSVGGKKIIKSVGMDMVRLEKYQGFSADLAATGCLLLSTLFGIPVSTTHTKTTAIMGVGAVKRMSAINYKVVYDMVLTWVLTFPGCGAIGFFMAKLFMRVFL